MRKVENYTLTNQELIMPFSTVSFLDQQPNLPTVQTFTHSEDGPTPIPLILSSASAYSTRYDDEQTETMLVSESLGDSSPPYSATGCAQKNKNQVGNKRKRNNDRLQEKPQEVIHVRAKRGQATDSHSLAERVRREKINEKLRCLQELVPGCYKAMGMAVMLDVIINYVQSLQNQIEFLSMKLSAASMYFDFNPSDMDATETMQSSTGTHGIQEMERMAGESCGGLGYFNSTWPLY